jgi:hypothetical protein
LLRSSQWQRQLQRRQQRQQLLLQQRCRQLLDHFVAEAWLAHLACRQLALGWQETGLQETGLQETSWR